MPLPCYCVDIRKYDFRGDYITDKQLRRTIDNLVGNTLITAAAEDVTDRILHEALLKAKGGSYTKRFIMTSKLPATKSEDETTIDSKTPTVPQGDTPLTPEVMKMVNTLSTIDAENPVICSEKESLEEEIKRMISKISAFELEPSPGKNLTEGKGDAEVVETAPTGMGEICESQATSDLLLHKDSSKEWIFQENKDNIAAWEEAVEIEVQIIGPSYDEENTPVYYRETVSPYNSSMESISDSQLMEQNICSNFRAPDGDIGSYELKHPTYEDGLSTKATSDELELETLAICTSIVVEIMSKVEETIVANKANIHHKEANVADTINISQIKELDKHGEINEEISATKQVLTKTEETKTISPVISTIESLVDPIYGQTSTEASEEEDVYDIESINVHSEDILEHNAHHKPAEVSDNIQKSERHHELKTYEKVTESSVDKHTFKNTTGMTTSFLSFQSSIEETSVLPVTTAYQELLTTDIKVYKTSMKEKECFEECNITVFKNKEDTVVDHSSLPANNEYLKTEHLESFKVPINIHYKMGNRVQSCDDIFTMAAEPQLDSTVLLDNTFERSEMSPTTSARSFDSLPEAHYKNKELEEIKYQPEQRGNLTSSINIERRTSPILKQKDEVQNAPLIQNEGTEDRQTTSTSIALKCIDELLETLDVQAPETNQNKTENHSEAHIPIETKDSETSDGSAFGAKNITHLFASISTIIKDGLETTEIAKTEEEVCIRTKSSQNLTETAAHSEQKNIQEDVRSTNDLEAASISSEEKSVGYYQRESLNITKVQHSSKHKTVKDNLQIPSSTQDERSARKKHDIDSSVCSRKKLIPGEAANRKVHKTWKFGNKMKKLISSLRRKK